MEPRNYRAYLLRLWRENESEPWRATLEDPHTGEQVGFAGVDRLLAYLREQLGEARAAPDPAGPGENSLDQRDQHQDQQG